MTWANPDLRRRRLSAIHVAKAQLQMADESYRALLARVSAEHGDTCTSAADLTYRQAMAVLDEMRAKGAKLPKINTRRGRTRPADFPGRAENRAVPFGEVEKIEALLTDLQLPWSYADAIAKRMFGIERLAWCKRQEQFVSVLAALHVEQDKREKLAVLTQLASERGQSLDELVAPIQGLRKGWRRHRDSLAALIEHFCPEPIGLEEIST